jgi:hypothetical protein
MEQKHIERLKRVRQRIVDEKEHFSYATFMANNSSKSFFYGCDSFSDGVTVKEDEPKWDCGTVACVAGFACVEAIREKKNWDLLDCDLDNASKFAKRYLGLSDCEESFLFYCSGIFGFPYMGTDEATIEDALKRIDYLINKYEAKV